ncbi:MAG: hypothetical protein U0401_22175 [Anaerolineae bacterium]
MSTVAERLWNKIPDSYKHCHTYNDFWGVYQKVFSSQTHQAVGKETGQTAHMERWYNTLHARGWLVLCVKPFLSPSQMLFIIWLPSGSSLSTI